MTKTEKITCAIGIILIILAGVLSLPAKSDPLAELGITYAFYQDDTKSGNIFTDSQSNNGFSGALVRGGVQGFPVYAVLNYEEFNPRLEGQNNGAAEGVSVGLGVRHWFNDFLVFAEAGYTWLDWETGSDANHREITYTYLVKRHAVPGRPIPVDQYYHEWEQSFDDAPFLRLGVGWQVFEHFQVGVSYKWLEPDAHIAIWDSERRENDEGYWREDSPADFSSAELHLIFTF